MNPQLPKTQLDVHPVAIYNMKSYSAEGISFIPIKSMKLWKVSCEGKMKYNTATVLTFQLLILLKDCRMIQQRLST